jgi:hypothetical protein
MASIIPIVGAGEAFLLQDDRVSSAAFCSSMAPLAGRWPARLSASINEGLRRVCARARRWCAYCWAAYSLGVARGDRRRQDEELCRGEL